jgi:FkbM family methyltransferase
MDKIKEQIPDWLFEEVEEYHMDTVDGVRTILDIGANCGAFSIKISEQYPNAFVYAYEPFPASCKRYKKFLKSNGRCILTEAAVRSFNGRCNLYLNEQDVKNSCIKKSDTAINVKCISAMDLPVAEFIKIDTEGAEVEILKSLQLSQCRAIVIEYHSMDDRDTIHSSLSGYGFTCVNPYTLINITANVGVLKYIRK